MTQTIDGKAFADGLVQRVAAEVTKLKAASGKAPGLATVLVGADPASEVYVRNKGKRCMEAGMESFDIRLPATTSQAELIAKVEELNKDPRVSGILVQLPLPKHLDENAVINAISPAKDVDGFHVINAGRLLTGQESLVPCTPFGCILLLRDVLKDSLAGKHAVVIGRSNIVGKPMSVLLLRESCTVTICHSRTANLAEEVKRADIIVAAIGKPNFVQGDWVKKGAVVIDVGINRITLPDGSTKLVGDVDYASAAQHAAAITPVPGGVGPMTIACLLRNTLYAFCAQQNIAFPL